MEKDKTTSTLPYKDLKNGFSVTQDGETLNFMGMGKACYQDYLSEQDPTETFFDWCKNSYDQLPKTTSTEQLKELLSKITQGEWTIRQSSSNWWYIETDLEIVASTWSENLHENEDAELISIAPTLAAEVIELREKNKLLSNICQTTHFVFDNEANYPYGTIGYNIAKEIEAALNPTT